MLNKISILNALLFARFSTFLINSREHRGTPRLSREQTLLENFDECLERVFVGQLEIGEQAKVFLNVVEL